MSLTLVTLKRQSNLYQMIRLDIFPCRVLYYWEPPTLANDLYSTPTDGRQEGRALLPPAENSVNYDDLQTRSVQ
jgi:hypothetical protein